MWPLTNKEDNVVEIEYSLAVSGSLTASLNHTIVYTYDNLYRLTEADYTSGENYQYSYDPVGNRLQQIINGDTTAYLYDAANRLVQVDGQSYTFDDNGNLLQTGVMTNSWDAANRLVESSRDGATIEPIYNGVNDRVAQTIGLSTTYYALDMQGLPEVIYTSEGNAYLHLPGVIMTESSTGQVRYLLSDGLGSVRQAVDETGTVVAYNEFDPYGNPVQNGSEPYGYTGEWWQDEVGLLHLRARWYLPETGTFLSVDPVESEPPYVYVRANPVNRTDPSGYIPRIGEVGNTGGRGQHYSCRCGWIDTGHAGSKKGFIDRVRQVRQQRSDPYWSSWVVFSESRPTSVLDGNIRLKQLRGYFEVDKRAVMSDKGAYEVALGMYIAFENVFETTQGYKVFELSQSSFAEEDLVSDLIGFHIGIGQATGERCTKQGCLVRGQFWANFLRLDFGEMRRFMTGSLKTVKNRRRGQISGQFRPFLREFLRIG